MFRVYKSFCLAAVNVSYKTHLTANIIVSSYTLAPCTQMLLCVITPSNMAYVSNGKIQILITKLN
jgi:hypothetical protein